MNSKADIIKYPDTGYLDAFDPGTSKPYPIVIEFDQLLQFPVGIGYTDAGSGLQLLDHGRLVQPHYQLLVRMENSMTLN